MHIYSGCYLSEKGGETSKSKILKFKKGNIGIVNMHKKYRRQDRDPEWPSHAAAR